MSPLQRRLLFVAAGVSFLLAIHATAWTLRLIQKGVRASGTVTAASGPVGRKGLYRDLIVVVNAGARTVEMRIRTDSIESFSEGDHVDVLYDPEKPEGARIGTFWQLWGEPFLLAVVGGVALVVAVARRRREARQIAQ